MLCSKCQGENESSSLFCIFCGSKLNIEGSVRGVPSEEDVTGATSDQVSLEGLQSQVQGLQQEIRVIHSTLARHGLREVGPQELGEISPKTDVQPTVSIPIRGDQNIRSNQPSDRGVLGGIHMDWELILGGNWLARIGVLAVVIGTGFFLNLAFENAWIGETGRTVLGLVGGLACLGASQYWQKRYPIYAQALAGGGIALLYLSIFASFVIFGLITLYPAVGLLFSVSVAASVLALKHNSVALAIIGILGAFGAPIILSGFGQTSLDVVHSGQSISLIVYVIVVDVGVLFLSTFRSWRWLTLIALVGSLLSYEAWYGEYGTTVSLLISQGSLTIIFLLFVGATTFYHIIWRRTPRAMDYSLMSINAIAFFVISYELLSVDFRQWMGGFTLILSLFYGVMAYVSLRRNREHVYMSLMFSGIALVLLTIAVPVQLSGQWISIAWAVQGAVIMWLSFVLRMPQMRIFSIGIFVAMAVRLIVVDTQVDLEEHKIILNYRMLAFGFGIAALYVASYLIKRSPKILYKWENNRLFPALLIGANFLTIWVLSAEVISAVDNGIVDVNSQSAVYAKSLSLSLLWAIYASLGLVLGIAKRWRVIRIASLVLLAVPIIKLFLVDSFALEAGYRVVAFLGLGGLLIAGGFLYQRYSVAIKGFFFEEQQISP